MSSLKGRVHRINVSDGGVPKLPVERAAVETGGIEGDRQRDLKHHGGPSRAVCLFGLDVIERLRAEGHPIVPGAVGENITVSGVDWSAVAIGTRFRFAGGVELEVTSWARPCSNIRDAFNALNYSRIDPEAHAAEARAYARVLSAGEIRVGEELEIAPGEPQTDRSRA